MSGTKSGTSVTHDPLCPRAKNPKAKGILCRCAFFKKFRTLLEKP
jgi:hypothetical protein